MLRAFAIAALLAVAGTQAHAAPKALSDDELSGVSGQDGVSIGVHLELNAGLLDGQPTDSRIVAGFNVNGTKTYAVVHNLAGVMTLLAVTLDVRHSTELGSDYLDIGLPQFIAFKQFGFRALTAQTDPTAPIAPTASYGQVLLNGTATMTGNVYIWAAP